MIFRESRAGTSAEIVRARMVGHLDPSCTPAAPGVLMSSSTITGHSQLVHLPALQCTYICVCGPDRSEVACNLGFVMLQRLLLVPELQFWSVSETKSYVFV